LCNLHIKCRQGWADYGTKHPTLPVDLTASHRDEPVAEMNDPRGAATTSWQRQFTSPGKPLVITIGEHIGALAVPPSPR
jgi:hypothetical protein